MQSLVTIPVDVVEIVWMTSTGIWSTVAVQTVGLRDVVTSQSIPGRLQTGIESVVYRYIVNRDWVVISLFGIS